MQVGVLQGVQGISWRSEMGPWPVTPEVGNGEQQQSRNRHNPMSDLPGAEATSLLGSRDPGTTVLGQELEATK